MDWIDAQEAARILDVTDRQISYWLNSGELKGRKKNASYRNSPWLIERQSVERLKKARESQAK